MNQKETFNSTVKNHDLDLLVSFDCRDDLVHLRKHLRTEDVERRVIKRNSPILGRALGQTYLSGLCLCYCVILIFHGCFLLFIWFPGGTLANSRTTVAGVDHQVCRRLPPLFRDSMAT